MAVKSHCPDATIPAQFLCTF